MSARSSHDADHDHRQTLTPALGTPQGRAVDDLSVRVEGTGARIAIAQGAEVSGHHGMAVRLIGEGTSLSDHGTIRGGVHLVGLSAGDLTGADVLF